VATSERLALERVAEEIRSEGGRSLVVPTDVSDESAVSRMVERTVSELGRLDAACNNAAGGGHPPTPLADVPVESFDSGIAETLRGVFLCLRHEIPAMLENGGGAIVNISSTAGIQGVGGLAAYVSAKHGLEGLTKVAALDYAAGRVRVNAIAPGAILTDDLVRAGEAAQKGAAAATPVRRIGSPEEVADAAVYLSSPAAAFITGATLVLDGGRLAGTPPFQVVFGRAPG
jgi:NAD(P)-dependent dehydrogenase (short-subunit alcohol dehydrogenase family)